MSDKPALYVVEKKEVVILVILFVLVTVLSFTMGVRYGETVGKKAAQAAASARAEHGGEAAEHLGGTLGQPEKHGAEPTAKGEGEHGAAAEGAHEAAGHGEKAEHGEKPEHGEGHLAKAEDSHGKPEAKEAESAEAAPKGREGGAPGREGAEKNSDEYLLNALKDAGVEPPGGPAPKEAKLPSEVKRTKSGTYVIQVGSHPTRGEAESQIRALKGKKVSAEVLAPFKDKQGEWHRVVIGSYKTKREAEREAGQLKARGAILSFFVWRLP